MTILTLSNLSKTYAGVPALKDVSLQISGGEVHALMGENGAGKSTLIKILAGVVRSDAGTISLDDRELLIADANDAENAGFRFIHQELNIVPQVSVAENIFIGRSYPVRLGLFVDWSELNRLARETLSLLDIRHIDPAQKMARLSLGDQMLVKIASAFLEHGGVAPLLYVMDEPTAALTDEESLRLFKVIDRLKSKGAAILYVSHRMEEVMAIADRITVMRDGEVKATLARETTDKSAIIELMTGRTLSEAFPARRSPLNDAIALEVRNLSGHGIKDVAFSLRRGEILGLAGLAGSGQSEVLNLIMGAAKAKQQDFLLDGKRIWNRDPAEAWANGFAAVPRERRAHGLMLSRPIFDNATLPHLALLSRLSVFLDQGREIDHTEIVGKRVRLKSRNVQQIARQLSGGNQQKVVFARTLGSLPKVLLLDEPTRGVDIGARFDIYQLLRELCEQGVSIILASTDLSELIGLADRLLIMKHGRLAAEVSTDGLTQAALLSLCYSQDVNNLKTGTFA